ncbi:MAG: CoA pyrophosphatase [Pseudomonadota bacterium]
MQHSIATLASAAPRLAAGFSSSDLDLSAVRGRSLGTPRSAAVLVPLRDTAQGTQVILTRRARGLRHHPGQIAFPGGKLDAGDPSLEACALREAAEEIGLAPTDVRPLGRLSPHRTVTGFEITPILGAVARRFVPHPEAGEVDEVFEVPLAHLIDPAHHQIHTRVFRGEERRYYVIPYGPHYIWGATARIIIRLASGLHGTA